MSFLNFIKDAAKEVSREVTNIVNPQNHKVELKFFKQKHNITFLSKCPKCGKEGGGKETHIQRLFYIDGKPETYQNGKPIIKWVTKSNSYSCWGACWCIPTSVFIGKCQHCERTVKFFKGNLFKQGKDAVKLLSNAVTAIGSGFGAARKIGGYVYDVYQSYENAVENSDFPITESRVGYCSFCNSEHVYCDVCDSTTQVKHTPGKIAQDFRCANCGAIIRYEMD